MSDRVIPFVAGGADRSASAGATLLYPGGWRASLFVTYFGSRFAPGDEALRIKPTSSVSARLSRVIAKDTRFTMEVFNVFDRAAGDADHLTMLRPWSASGMNESYLSGPAEPRAFRVRIHRTF